MGHLKQIYTTVPIIYLSQIYAKYLFYVTASWTGNYIVKFKYLTQTASWSSL